MEKEIPISPEKNNKAARLREASQRLHSLALDRVPTAEEWDAATQALTGDEIEHLKKLAQGYRERALDAESPLSDRLDEASSAVLLWPRDTWWARECLQRFRDAGWQGKEAESFLALLRKRTGGRTGKKLPVWVVPFLIALLAVPAGLGLAAAIWTNLTRGAGVSPIQGPRDLTAVFDTQGVKANIQVAQSRMLIFPEATVAEVSAWVSFPEHRVDVWEGVVSVLDAQGQPLTRREVSFHASAEGPLEPGQGVEIFEQFDAWPFYDKVSSFQVTTTRILAQEAHPKDRKEMPVEGLESLTSGFNLKVWIQDSQWADRFASRAQTLVLELENTGLKPFSELQFALLWRDSAGKTLKTILFRPVSAFRTALPSGSRLAWTQETIFDTEVFALNGEEPHPVLELRQWQ